MKYLDVTTRDYTRVTSLFLKEGVFFLLRISERKQFLINTRQYVIIRHTICYKFLQVITRRFYVRNRFPRDVYARYTHLLCFT